MWKEEIEKELGKSLNKFTVTIPHKKLEQKQTKWQRFIRYLATPVKDPYEEITDTFRGYQLVKMVPLATVLILAVIPLFFI